MVEPMFTGWTQHKIERLEKVVEENGYEDFFRKGRVIVATSKYDEEGRPNAYFHSDLVRKRHKIMLEMIFYLRERKVSLAEIITADTSLDWVEEKLKKEINYLILLDKYYGTEKEDTIKLLNKATGSDVVVIDLSA